MALTQQSILVERERERESVCVGGGGNVKILIQVCVFQERY